MATIGKKLPEPTPLDFRRMLNNLRTTLQNMPMTGDAVVGPDFIEAVTGVSQHNAMYIQAKEIEEHVKERHFTMRYPNLQQIPKTPEQRELIRSMRRLFLVQRDPMFTSFDI